MKAMSSTKGKSKMRKRSKSVHTSVPFSLEIDPKPEAASDEEFEIPDLDQTNAFSGAEDNESDGWSSGDEQELVENIRQFTSKSDKLKYSTRIQRLDWTKVAFKKHSPKECQERFAKYLKMVRNYRTLHEILSDVEEEIKRIPFKKPLNSYQLFVQDQLLKAQSSGDFANKMKNLASLYKNLPPEEREKYDKKSKEARDEYNKKKMEYLAEKNPDSLKTPLYLFSLEWKLKDSKLTASQLRHKYEELPQNEKFKWVEKAVKLNAGISLTSFLSRDEQRLYKGLPKSVGTAYSIFVKEKYAEVKERHEDGANVFHEIAQAWKGLSAAEKEKYKKKLSMMKEEALNETQAINAKFGVKVTKMKRAPPKTKKSKSKEMVDSDDEDKDDHKDHEDHEAPPSPLKSPQKSPQKRKLSATESSEDANEVEPAKKVKSTAIKKEFASPAPVNTSTPHTKSKKRNDTVSSEDATVGKTNIMVQIPKSQVNGDQSEEPTETKKKKKKKDKSSANLLSNSIHDSEAEASTSSSVSVSKKKKKDESPAKKLNSSQQESEAEASTGSSVSGSKNPKAKNANEIEVPIKRPPSTLEEYYATHVYTGKPRKMKKAFKKLSKKEVNEITAQHKELVDKYCAELETFLGTLTKEEATLVIKRLKAEETARVTQSDEDESQVY